MAKGYLFSNKNMAYSEYLTILKNACQEPVDCFHNAADGLVSASSITDLERRKKLINVSIEIDRERNEPNSSKPNLTTTLPRIMGAAVIIANHYDDIKNLSDEQLILLSHMAYNVQEYEAKMFLKKYKDGKLLQAAIDKNWNFMDTEMLLQATEHFYFLNEDDVKLSDDHFEKNKDAALSFIKEMTKEELIKKDNEARVEAYDSMFSSSKK